MKIFFKKAGKRRKIFILIFMKVIQMQKMRRTVLPERLFWKNSLINAEKRSFCMKLRFSVI